MLLRLEKSPNDEGKKGVEVMDNATSEGVQESDESEEC